MKNTRTLIINLRKLILLLIIYVCITGILISLFISVKFDSLSDYIVIKSADVAFFEASFPTLLQKKSNSSKIEFSEFLCFLLNENIKKPINILNGHILFLSTVKEKMKEHYGYADESNNYYIPQIIEKYFGTEPKKEEQYNPATEKSVKSIRNNSGEPGKYGIILDNKTSYNPDIKQYYSMPLSINKKSVLIVHTHGSEGYNPTDRNENIDKNVVKVGKEMKEVFESNGITVYHSEIMHDIPKFNNSYKNSLATVNDMLKKHPDIGVVLDIHRDAMISSSGEVYKVVCDSNGEKIAQVMFVVGTNEGGLSHDNWRSNFNFAVKCQKRVNELVPNLARPINVRTERFNQHTTPCSLIIEVGTNGNTLYEAITSAKITAQAIADVIKLH